MSFRYPIRPLFALYPNSAYEKFLLRTVMWRHGSCFFINHTLFLLQVLDGQASCTLGVGFIREYNTETSGWFLQGEPEWN